MIALKCARCGHAVQLRAATQEREIACPHCGLKMPSDSASADSKTISAPASPPGTEADFSVMALTKKEPLADETLAPRAATKVEVFSFLSPAQQSDELGWLAHYRVMRLLGQGGMGIVFEAIDTQLQRTVALKVMKPDIAKDEMARQRFLREARMTASLKSDHIVIIHQVGQNNDVPFLAMEFLQGESLDKWLERHGRPSLQETLHIGMEITRGLSAAHELGLIHRDIKPANIWLESSGASNAKSGPTPQHSSFRVKILDFGLARIARDKGGLTQTGLVMGTPAYMAPEQAEGGEVDARCDLFSLGCVLYELATGSKPFTGTNTMAILMAVAMKEPLPPEQLNPDLPPSLCAVILRLLAKKPQDRPASARVVAEALQAIGDELGISGQTPTSGTMRFRTPMPTMTPFRAPPRRRPLVISLVALGTLLAILLVGGLLYSLFFSKHEGEILLGMSGPLNGPSKELGRDMELGIKIYTRYINDQGGVHGRKLKLVALDDGYEPDAALDNMRDLHEQRNVFAVIGNIGTPTAMLTVPYAVENKLLFFGAFTGAKVLRKDPPDRYVFNYRASYEEETAKIVEYLVESRKVRPYQIAVFDQHDAFGDAGFAGVVKVLRTKYKRDPNNIVRVRYDRNTIHVKEAVQEILSRPDLKAVVMVGTYKPVTEFLRQIKDAERDLIFTNVSFVGSEALADGLRELGPKYTEGVIVTQVVPPIDSHASVVLKYHELRTKYFPNERPSFTSLEGYISTALFVEGLKRAGDNPTTEKMIDALESIRHFDLGTGAPLSFGQSEHQASHKVWGTILDKAGHYKVLDLTE